MVFFLSGPNSGATQSEWSRFFVSGPRASQIWLVPKIWLAPKIWPALGLVRFFWGRSDFSLKMVLQWSIHLVEWLLRISRMPSKRCPDPKCYFPKWFSSISLEYTSLLKIWDLGPVRFDRPQKSDWPQGQSEQNHGRSLGYIHERAAKPRPPEGGHSENT